MIRYDLYSNIASSDHGLQHFPSLQDLVENLRLSGLDTRFTRVQQREEGEMNMASAKFGGGVKVKSSAVKMVPPEQSLTGLLTWLRTATTRIDRGLHVDLERVRQTNGAPLIIARALTQGHAVFVSGLDAPSWARMVAKPDMTGEKIPDVLARLPEAQGEYLQRRVRSAGFYPMLKPLLGLSFLGPSLRERINKLYQSRDNGQLQDLPEPAVINLGLISDGLERYQKLIDQFYGMLSTAEAGGELPFLFDLLVQEIPFAAVMDKLSPFLLEGRREHIRDNRGLVHELRIAMKQQGAEKRQEFQEAMVSLVLGARLEKDPGVYLKASRLRHRTPEIVDALSVPRRLFLAYKAVADAEPAAEPTAPASVPLKQSLFEMVVQITYQAQYNHSYRENQVPPHASIARELLAMMVFDTFNIGQLKGLNPALPPRGVAKGLADKTPLARGEADKLKEPLERALYPLAAVGAKLAKVLGSKFKDADQQKKTEQFSVYLRGGTSLLSFTNYVLGTAKVDPLLRRAVAEAGRLLGTKVVESADKIFTVQAPDQPAKQARIIQGYVPLFNREDSSPFPVRSRPELLMLGYQHLYLLRVSAIVRRYLSQKIKYLYERFANRLFEVIYRHVIWSQNLSLSRRQLGEMLIEGGVLERERLRDFGYGLDMDAATENENPWLKFRAEEEGEQQASVPITPEVVEQNYRKAHQRAVQLLKSYAAAKAPDGTPSSCKGAIFRVSEKEPLLSLTHPSLRAALAASTESAALAAELTDWLKASKDAVLGKEEPLSSLVLSLAGPHAFLSLLKESHTITLDGHSVNVRLIAAWELEGDDLDPPSQSFHALLRTHLDPQANSPAGAPLRQVVADLREYHAARTEVVAMASAIFVDQALKETVLRLVVPAQPVAKDLIKIPEGRVLCLGTSSFDQGKFSRLVQRPDRKDVYATLSEMASRLMRLQRLREEFDFYRAMIADIQGIISSFSVSYETAYMQVYSRALTRLDQALSVRPEDISRGDLAQIETTAKEVSTILRDIYEQERSLGLRDRWLNRTMIALRQLRPNAKINFVETLFPNAADTATPQQQQPLQPQAPAEDSGEGGEAREREFQTFRDRMLNAIQFREWMAPKGVIVLSPSNTQQKLTMHLLDQLYQLKGVYIPILVNTASCDTFIDALLTRIPPHRLFNLNEM